MKLTLTTFAAAALMATAAQASIPGAGDPLPRDVAEGAKSGFATSGVQSAGAASDRFTPRDQATMGGNGDITVWTFSNGAQIDESSPSDPTLFR